MIQTLRQNRLQSLFAWLALAAVLIRAVIPAGFMPVHAHGNAPGLQLALCHGSQLIAGKQAPTEGQAQSSECAFALAAMAAIPSALPAIRSVFAETSASSDPAVLPSSRGYLRQRPPTRAPPEIS